MCTKSDIPQGEHYYIGVKLIKARVAYRINGNEIVYDLNRARNPNDVLKKVMKLSILITINLSHQKMYLKRLII